MTESNWALCWTSAFPWRLDIVTAISALCFSIFFCAISTDYSSSGHVSLEDLPGRELLHFTDIHICIAWSSLRVSFLFFSSYFSFLLLLA